MTEKMHPRDPARRIFEPPTDREDVVRVFLHWKKACGFNHAKLGQGDFRAEIIANRIDAYSEGSCNKVITQASVTGWHNGSNPDERVRLRIEQIMGSVGPSHFEDLLREAVAGEVKREKTVRLHHESEERHAKAAAGPFVTADVINKFLEGYKR